MTCELGTIDGNIVALWVLNYYLFCGWEENTNLFERVRIGISRRKETKLIIHKNSNNKTKVCCSLSDEFLYPCIYPYSASGEVKR